MKSKSFSAKVNAKETEGNYDGLLMHTISTRSPSPEELRLITPNAKHFIAGWGCSVVLFGIGPAYFFGKLASWLGGFISQEASTYCQWIGWLLGLVLFVSLVITFIPYLRRVRSREARDQQEGIVQEIHIVEPRVIEIDLINDDEPILAFDIGNNKILFLQGQWLRDAGTYGTDGPEGDPFDEFINYLPAPHSFPSSEFTISRFPHSGRVLGIRVKGEYVAPKEVVDALRPEYEFCDSEVFDGALDDVANVLKREHERRIAR